MFCIAAHKTQFLQKRSGGNNPERHPQPASCPQQPPASRLSAFICHRFFSLKNRGTLFCIGVYATSSRVIPSGKGASFYHNRSISELDNTLNIVLHLGPYVL